MANHFVAARKGDPFIQKWHELFIHLWKGRKNGDGIIASPLIAFALEPIYTIGDGDLITDTFLQQRLIWGVNSSKYLDPRHHGHRRDQSVGHA